MKPSVYLNKQTPTRYGSHTNYLLPQKSFLFIYWQTFTGLISSLLVVLIIIPTTTASRITRGNLMYKKIFPRRTLFGKANCDPKISSMPPNFNSIWIFRRVADAVAAPTLQAGCTRTCMINWLLTEYECFRWVVARWCHNTKDTVRKISRPVVFLATPATETTQKRPELAVGWFWCTVAYVMKNVPPPPLFCCDLATYCPTTNRASLNKQ